jgi:hypothetical protein
MKIAPFFLKSGAVWDKFYSGLQLKLKKIRNDKI